MKLSHMGGLDYRIKLFLNIVKIVASTTVMVNFIMERKRLLREIEGEISIWLSYPFFIIFHANVVVLL